MPLTPEARVELYQVAKRVFDAQLTPTEGADLLHEQHEVNEGSAKIMFEMYKHLRLGRLYKRFLSTIDMDYFLSQILADNGASGLQTALHSLWQHITYFESQKPTTKHELRELVTRYQALAGAPVTAEEADESFEEKVARSTQDAAARRARLAVAPAKPQRVPIVRMGFVRSPDVVAEVRYLANGICGRCGQPAPFNRRADGSPYLEVHHVRQLADGGDDTVANAVALCPNCHRRQHHGEPDA